jgi:hypothetical protein
VDGQTVEVTEGVSLAFTCITTGSYPRPDIALWLGNKEVTSDFSVVTSFRQQGNQPLGLKALSYDSSASQSAMTIDYIKHHNRTLKCVARLPDSKFSPRDITIRIMVTQCKWLLRGLC